MENYSQEVPLLAVFMDYSGCIRENVDSNILKLVELFIMVPEFFKDLSDIQELVTPVIWDLSILATIFPSITFLLEGTIESGCQMLGLCGNSCRYTLLQFGCSSHLTMELDIGVSITLLVRALRVLIMELARDILCGVVYYLINDWIA